jgi:hypothetical protein
MTTRSLRAIRRMPTSLPRSCQKINGTVSRRSNLSTIWYISLRGESQCPFRPESVCYHHRHGMIFLEKASLRPGLPSDYSLLTLSDFVLRRVSLQTRVIDSDSMGLTTDSQRSYCSPTKAAGDSSIGHGYIHVTYTRSSAPVSNFKYTLHYLSS